MSGGHEESDDDPDQPGCSGLSHDLGRCSITETGNTDSLSVNKQISKRDILNVFFSNSQGDLCLGSQSCQGDSNNKSYQNWNNTYSSERTLDVIKKDESLKNFYRVEESWLTPVPLDKKFVLDSDDVFVEIDMDKYTRSGRFIKKSCKLEQLFDPSEGEVSPPNRILITGEAGYGKSTICSKICQDWAKGGKTFTAVPRENTLLVLYRLRNLAKGLNLENELLEFIHFHFFKPADNISKTVGLIEKLGKLLLVLDGYDELRTPKQKYEVQKLFVVHMKKGKSHFRNALVIVTSRPGVEDETFPRLFDREYRMVGVNKEKIPSFVSRFFDNEERKIDNFWKVFNNLYHMFGNYFSPIILTLLCYSQDYREVEKIGSAQELLEFVLFLIIKRNWPCDGKHLVDEEIWSKLDSFGEYFLKYTINKMEITVEELTTCLGDDDCKLLQQSGLLKIKSTSRKYPQILEPVHRLLTDCLAVRYINREWKKMVEKGDCLNITSGNEIADNPDVHINIYEALVSSQIDIFIFHASEESNRVCVMITSYSKYALRLWWDSNQYRSHLMFYSLDTVCLGPEYEDQCDVVQMYTNDREIIFTEFLQKLRPNTMPLKDLEKVIANKVVSLHLFNTPRVQEPIAGSFLVGSTPVEISVLHFVLDLLLDTIAKRRKPFSREIQILMNNESNDKSKDMMSFLSFLCRVLNRQDYFRSSLDITLNTKVDKIIIYWDSKTGEINFGWFNQETSDRKIFKLSTIDDERELFFTHLSHMYSFTVAIKLTPLDYNL